MVSMIKEKIDISVVIPLYNKAAAITSTIQSVLAQSYPYFEIVIIDDGSSDNSVQKVRLIDDKRIKLISKQNGGVSSARNYGIRMAKYEYLAFLDADDYWEPSYLEELINLINDFPNAGLYGLDCVNLWNDNKITNVNNLPLLFRGYIDNPWNSGCIYWTGSSSVTTKTVIQSVGFF